MSRPTPRLFLNMALHIGAALSAFVVIGAVSLGLIAAWELRGYVETRHSTLGEQAATVLALLREEATEERGGTWSAADADAFKAPIREQYEKQGHPYYATARIWDDGIIDPADTRMVLALALAAGLNAPAPAPTRFGVFRM